MAKHATIRLKGLKVMQPIPAELVPVDLVPADGPAGNPAITLELEGVGPVCTAVLNGKSYRRMLKALAERGPEGVTILLQGTLGLARVGCRCSRVRASRPCPGHRRRRPKAGQKAVAQQLESRPGSSPGRAVPPRGRRGPPRSPATGPRAAGTIDPPSSTSAGPPRAGQGPSGAAVNPRRISASGTDR